MLMPGAKPPVCISESDLPAAYHSADKSSAHAQKVVIGSTVVNLAVLVIGSASAAVPASVAWVAAAVLFTGFILTFVIRLQGKEKIWHSGRGLAESIKTLAWRYMMGADPLKNEERDDAADIRFLQAIRELLNSRASALEARGSAATGHPQITAKMREVRELGLKERLQVYVECRLERQRQWYSEKAESNARLSSRIYWISAAAQALAIFFVITRATFPALPLHPTAPLAALASSLIAWAQLKRYQEHAQAYSFASHELGLLREQAASVITQADLVAFVTDAEAAMSREHASWLSRRGA